MHERLHRKMWRPTHAKDSSQRRPTTPRLIETTILNIQAATSQLCQLYNALSSSAQRTQPRDDRLLGKRLLYDDLHARVSQYTTRRKCARSAHCRHSASKYSHPRRATAHIRQIRHVRHQRALQRRLRQARVCGSNDLWSTTAGTRQVQKQTN